MSSHEQRDPMPSEKPPIEEARVRWLRLLDLLADEVVRHLARNADRPTPPATSKPKGGSMV